MCNVWEDTTRDAGISLPKEKGVRYFVDGEMVTRRQAAEVAEDCRYMADYVMGKGGEIEEVYLDRVDP